MTTPVRMPATGPAPLEPAVLPGRTMAVVDRSIGLPGGWAGPPLNTAWWAAVVEEQRFLGSHADRIDSLSRVAYLGRILARSSGPGVHPILAGLSLLWFLAVAPPLRSGSITTTSAVWGTGAAVRQRVRYERGRARSPIRAGAEGEVG